MKKKKREEEEEEKGYETPLHLAAGFVPGCEGHECY